MIRPADEPEDLVELAKARAEIARKQLQLVEDEELGPRRVGREPTAANATGIDMDQYILWSRRWMEAQLDMSDTPAARASAIEWHVARLEKRIGPLRGLAEGVGATLSIREIKGYEFQLLEAKSLLSKERQGAKPGR